MIGRVSQSIKKYNMLPPGCSVLAGVSGGMDSIAMLNILCLLREKLVFCLGAAHFNHGIRAESAGEEQFVEALCANLGVPLYTGRADVPAIAKERGISVEVAARDARHAFFRKVMAEQQFDRLALAHHMDDQAETVLLRLIRGAGTDGLGAMAPVEESGIIRPLLCVGREEIHRWCAANGIEWREDISNADTSIPRNWVRHELMQQIRDHLNPSAASALCRAAELMRQDEQYLAAEAIKATAHVDLRPDGSVSIQVSSLEGLPTALKSRALRLLLRQAGLMSDVDQVNIDDVSRLLGEGMTGCRIDLDRGFVALREASRLVITPRLPGKAEYEPVPLKIPGKTAAAGGVFICEVLDKAPPIYKNHPKGVQFFDFDTFPPNAVARGRQTGDRFHPLGAPGVRKLKEYLIDRKISRWNRNDVPLVAAGCDVLWVVGYAMAEGVKVSEVTRKVLKITYFAGEDNS